MEFNRGIWCVFLFGFINRSLLFLKYNYFMVCNLLQSPTLQHILLFGYYFNFCNLYIFFRKYFNKTKNAIRTCKIIYEILVFEENKWLG